VTQLGHDLESHALHAEKARYQELFEFAPAGYLVTDDYGKIIEANRAAGSLLGVTATHLIGKPIAMFVPAETRRGFRKTLLGLTRSKSAVEWELEIQGRKERRFHAQLLTAPAFGGGLRWMIQDVSERVEAERRLRTLASALEERVLERTHEAELERARLLAVVEQMPGGVIIVESLTGDVLTVNGQARKLLAMEDGDPLYGLEKALRADGSPYAPDETPLARALDGETIVAERVELRGPDGEKAVLNVSASPVRDRSGRITAAVSLIEDVMEREARDRAERDFVANAAHELQTPLAAITSAVEVLQAGAKEAAERDLFIEHIEREAQRLARLIQALMTLARAETGLEDPRSEVIDLAALLEEIVDRKEPATGVLLTVDCPDDLAVVANRELLAQAISNVVRNAAKFTVKGSIEVGAAPRDGSVEIRVTDTGPGIAADTRSRLVERFYQADASKEGFGLGLSIVQSSVRAMGGQLVIESEGLGCGTTVSIRIPLGARRVSR
jgi:PAS domain S-box-containing protein